MNLNRYIMFSLNMLAWELLRLLYTCIFRRVYFVYQQLMTIFGVQIHFILFLKKWQI